MQNDQPRKKDLIRQFFNEQKGQLSNEATYHKWYNKFAEWLREKNFPEVSYAYFYRFINEERLQEEPAPAQVATQEQHSQQEEQGVEVKYRKMADIKFPASVFEPMVTNTLFDEFCSDRGGVMPGTLTITPGEASSGKTTFGVWLGRKIKENQPEKNVLFISSELDPLNLHETLKGSDFLGDLDILFLSEYNDNSGRLLPALEKALYGNWDLIILDSMEDIKDKIADESDLSDKRAMIWFLNIMIDSKSGCPQERDGEKVFTKKFTAFWAVQQMLKSGKFAGINKLNHNTDAMMYVNFDGTTQNRHITYTKNRRGRTNLTLHYKRKGDDFLFDEKKYQRQLKSEELRQQIEEEVEQEEKSFDQKTKEEDGGAPIPKHELEQMQLRKERLSQGAFEEHLAYSLNGEEGSEEGETSDNQEIPF